MSTYHRVPAVVELAVFSMGDRDPLTLPSPRNAPLADRARASVSRISRQSIEVRDALWATLEAVAGLERELEHLHAVRALTEAGIELKREIVHVSADGVALQRRGPWADGEQVMLYLSIHLRDARHMLALVSTVDQEDDGAFFRFNGLSEDVKEMFVAFGFQQEAKERRRALAADDR